MTPPLDFFSFNEFGDPKNDTRRGNTMITRAQAEVLLKLAEALENCEKVDIRLEQHRDIYVNIAGRHKWIEPTPAGIRRVVDESTKQPHP